MPANQNPTPRKSVPYKQWEPYDLATLVLLLVTCGILLGLGSANIVALLRGSGNEIYLKTPALAYLLSAIVPATAVACKAGYHLCKLDRSRHTYAWVVFILAGIFALIWIVLFSISFEGSTGEIDYGALGEESGGQAVIDKLRTLTQILAEITVGSSIFLVIDRLHARYSSSCLTEKAGWRELKENTEELRHLADGLTELADADEAMVTQYTAARAVFTAEAASYLHDT